MLVVVFAQFTICLSLELLQAGQACKLDIALHAVHGYFSTCCIDCSPSCPPPAHGGGGITLVTTKSG